jgi:hypothetical protein
MNGSMTSNLSQAAHLLDIQAGELVTYFDGTYTVSWIARPANPDWVMVLDNGIVEEWEGLDFIGRPQLLKSTVGIITPKQGDTITRLNGKVYQVLCPKGKKVFDLSAYGETIRVHTKEVSL